MGSEMCIRDRDKVIRWSTRLADDSFKVEYIQGSENFMTDCMSRVFALAAVDSDSSMSMDSGEIKELRNWNSVSCIPR